MGGEHRKEKGSAVYVVKEQKTDLLSQGNIYTNIYFLFSKNFIKFYLIVKITRAFPGQSERTLDLDVLVQCTGLQRHGQ